MTASARADVATDSPDRYARQLVSHLGRKLTSETLDGGRHRIVFPAGECLLVEADGVLSLRARAEDAETLERVQRVVGDHLERFGQRAAISVRWQVDD